MNVHAMKMKWIATLALLLAAFSINAQDAPETEVAQGSPDQSLSLELFGAHNTVGVNYDRRLNGDHGWGFRVGVGYGYSERSSFLVGSYTYRIHGVAAPLEINYLLGKGRHKLELGFGASLGFYWEKLYAKDVYIPYGYSNDYGTYDIRYKSRTFGYFMFGNVGYRLQTKRGFQLRVGVTPSINFGDRYCVQREWFYPYVSFGWRLK